MVKNGGWLYSGSHDTDLWFTYFISSQVCGVIYQFLLRMKAGAASFDHGILSITWGAQVLTFFFLLVNCFLLLSLSKRSAIEFKCVKEEVLDLCTGL